MKHWHRHIDGYQTQHWHRHVDTNKILRKWHNSM